MIDEIVERSELLLPGSYELFVNVSDGFFDHTALIDIEVVSAVFSAIDNGSVVIYAIPTTGYLRIESKSEFNVGIRPGRQCYTSKRPSKCSKNT